jgi:hypothetical protein
VSWPPRRVSDFCVLFRHHFRNGTRPDGMPGKPGRRWIRREFASSANVSISAVVKWLAGKAHPNNFRPVEAAFFGDNPAYEAARRQLRDAYDLIPDGRKWSTARNALKNAIKQQWVINGVPITVHIVRWPRKTEQVAEREHRP